MNNDILPKGFEYLKFDSLLKRSKLIDSLMRHGKNINANVVEFPPVSFLSTFTKGAEILGDKVYFFQDKKKRDLVLTPDSLAHIFSYYINNFNQSERERFAWISPIFRYRNTARRFWLQVGFASVNYCSSESLFELALITRTLIKVIQQNTDLSICLRIINPSLIKEIIEHILQDTRLSNKIFEEWRKSNFDEQVKLFQTELPDGSHKDFLFYILNSDVTDYRNFRLDGNYKELRNVKMFSDIINFDKSIKLSIDLRSRHSAEVTSGISFIIETENGQGIGDGGLYHHYANSFSRSISTMASVCVGRGITPLLKEVSSALFYQGKILVIFCKSLTIDYVTALNLNDILISRGLSANIYFADSTSKKAIKKLMQKDEYKLCCVVEKISDGKIYGKVFQLASDNSQRSFNVNSAFELVDIFAQA